VIYALWGIIFLETVLLGFLGYQVLKFGRILLDIQDAIESSLDVLDKRYASISKVLQIPLFYDSPEIKRVYEDVKASRDSILYVANLMSKIEDVKEGSDEG
jgi:hypothetical protein